MGNVNRRDHPNPNLPSQYQGYYPPLPSQYHRQGPRTTSSSLTEENVEQQNTVTIQNHINLKKDTLRFVPDEANPGMFLLSFTFDATVSGSITVMFFAREGEDCNVIATKEDLYPSTTVSFEKGVGQKFKQACGTGIDFSALSEAELVEANETDVYHVAVKTEEAEDGNGQLTHAVLEKDKGLGYKVRVVKQILWVNGNKYVLQDIYGISNTTDVNEEDGSETGKECVICLTEPRDTTVLPCRHMCMCSGCAKLLRFQTNLCPICRQPVGRLLEITVNTNDTNL